MELFITITPLGTSRQLYHVLALARRKKHGLASFSTHLRKEVRFRASIFELTQLIQKSKWIPRALYTPATKLGFYSLRHVKSSCVIQTCKRSACTINISQSGECKGIIAAYPVKCRHIPSIPQIDDISDIRPPKLAC